MMLLLKTDDKNVEAVRKNAKHATDGVPHEVRPGDTLLIQVTYSSMDGTDVQRPPRHGVCELLRGCRTRERYALGAPLEVHHQGGRNLYQLRPPFDIEKVKVSKKNYGKGVIRYAYVDPADEAVIRAKYLRRA